MANAALNSSTKTVMPLLWLILAACSPSPPAATGTPGPAATHSPAPTATDPEALPSVTPLGGGVEPSRCLAEIERRPLRGRPPTASGEPEYTLSADEFEAYLNLMGIESLCIPPQIGAPFLNVDWNGFANPALAIGRMFSLGFEGLQDGGGWGRGYLVYSTYEFEVGTMYEVFAEPADLGVIHEGTQSIPVRVQGADGLIRYKPGYMIGPPWISKTYIFPFDDYYVSAVLQLGTYDPDEIDAAVRSMQAGLHPDLYQPEVSLMDRLVLSLRFD